MEERVGHSGVWNAAVSIHTSIQEDILGCKITSPGTALGFSSQQSITTQPGASLLCRDHAEGSHHHQAPPAVTTLGHQIHRSS